MLYLKILFCFVLYAYIIFRLLDPNKSIPNYLWISLGAIQVGILPHIFMGEPYHSILGITAIKIINLHFRVMGFLFLIIGLCKIFRNIYERKYQYR